MKSKNPRYISSRRLLLGIGIAELFFISMGLVFVGLEAEGLHWALRWTARFSAFLFLTTFLAGSLHRSLGRPWTAALLRKRRYWGLAFAFSQLIHLIFIGLAYREVPHTMGPIGIAFFGGALGYLFTGLLTLTSSDAAVHRLGFKKWKLLHSTGMYLLWAIFTTTYILSADQPLHLAMALVFCLALTFKIAVIFGSRKS